NLQKPGPLPQPAMALFRRLSQRGQPAATRWILCAGPLGGSCGFGRTARQAWPIFLSRNGSRDAGAGSVWFRESAGGQKSWRVLQKSALKFQPQINQTVMSEDTLKNFPLDGASLNELE